MGKILTGQLENCLGCFKVPIEMDISNQWHKKEAAIIKTLLTKAGYTLCDFWPIVQWFSSYATIFEIGPNFGSIVRLQSCSVHGVTRWLWGHNYLPSDRVNIKHIWNSVVPREGFHVVWAVRSHKTIGWYCVRTGIVSCEILTLRFTRRPTVCQVAYYRNCKSCAVYAQFRPVQVTLVSRFFRP